MLLAPNFRILLIDDDLESLAILEQTLAIDDRDVLKATGAREALEILKHEEIHMIIADMIMPEMDGFELLQALEAQAETRDIYTIIVIRRGEMLEEYMVRGFELGAYDYLIKPITPEIAKAKVNVVDKLHQQRRQLELQSKRVEELLLNILPERTAEELKISGSSTPRSFPQATVMFTDFKGFTQISSGMTPEALVSELDFYFRHFDQMIEHHNIEKIKTIGDAYMCVAGVPIRNRSNPIDATLAALDICNFMNETKTHRQTENGKAWEVRIGIHTGPLVAGVVGSSKWAYDVWGNTVNTAQRLETACIPGFVNISETTYELVGEFFDCEHRGQITAKHLGEIDMYFVLGIKPQFSEGRQGKVPNAQFRRILSQL